MSQAKTERLVNLTMALLNSRRYMRKSEIFQRVAGYSGSPETKERMFERDKDDLRSMGIEIEVSSQDPLFEDEPGYRIKPETYSLPTKSFSTDELAIISTALGLWRSSELEDQALNAARRVAGKDSFAEPLTAIAGSSNSILDVESGLVEITKALASRSTISFNYKKGNEAHSTARTVNPFGISNWRGSWYLVGEDTEKDDIRVFKLSRIVGSIDLSKKRDVFEIPDDFDIKDYLIMLQRDQLEIKVKVRKNQAELIRRKAKILDSADSDWDLLTFDAESIEDAAEQVLWFHDSVFVVEPIEVLDLVLDRLKKVANFS